MRIDYLAYPEVERYLEHDDRILIPVGSIEQHGVAVATGIDYLIPQALAERVARKMDLLCLPPLTIGMSLHHAAFPGTVSLKPTTYIAMLIDILEFLHLQGFRSVYFLNGHGGNVASIKAAAAQVAYNLDGYRIFPRNCFDFDYVKDISDELFGDDEGSHVTPSEVSLLMYIAPELVGDLTQCEKSEPGLIKWAPSPEDWKRFYPCGNVGSDPGLASAEAGERLFNAAVKGFSEFIKANS